MNETDISEQEFKAMESNGSRGRDVYVMVRNARQLREKYLSDPYRPGYHFVVPEGIHIPIDKSVVEVFANDRLAIARRIYPSRPDSVGISLFARGGGARAVRVNAWNMMPSNPC